MKEIKDLQLTATIPAEMVESQQQLIEWCGRKVAAERMECEELALSVDQAKKNHWKMGPFKRQHDRAVKRVEYYEKIRSALQAGYYIVPNFPIEMFAIRTKKDAPLKMFSSSQWVRRREQSEQELPVGVGEYQNPFPVVVRDQEIIDGKTYHQSWAEDWDQMEFPLSMAKPEIMEITGKTMARKIFDRIGVMPPVRKRKKHEDPVIVGQIVHKEGPMKERIVSFMIAWHLNTNVI